MKHFWNQEQLFFQAKDYFQALLADITKAQSSIELEVYIFRKDSIGETLIQTLCAAHQRGVDIRVLVDGAGSREDSLAISESLNGHGVEVRIFRPLPWAYPLFSFSLISGTWIEKLIDFCWKINKRNHRKLCVIDNTIAWVGSFNIADEHFGNDTETWKDLAVRVTDGNAVKLKQSFDQIWHQVEDTHTYKKRLKGFFSNHTWQLRKEKNRQLINRICQAKERIWITTAYFSPSYPLLKALYHANKRGVSVRLIVPKKSDVFIFPALSSTYYADLLSAGVRIFEYEGGILHEKSIIIDNIAIIGSTNLNYRSWFHDLELDVILNQASSIKELDFNFINSLRVCREITSSRFQRYSKTLLLLGWLSKLFRYWL